MKKAKKKVHIIRLSMGCVARERVLGFVKKGEHFSLLKTYVLRLNLGGLMNYL